MANPGSNLPPIIVKRVRKSGGQPHHGGAWKVAYADFVTAMMAFFLLLWLLNATTEEQRTAISNYFAPASVSETKSGAGGLLDGRSLDEGPMAAPGGPPGLVFALPPPPAEAVEEAEGPGADEAMRDADDARNPASERAKIDPNDKAALAKAAAMQERLQFEQAAAQLRQAMQETPELQQLAASLMVDQTSEGLRIQIVDQDRVEMFPRGSSVMHPHTRALLQKVVTAVQSLPHQIAVAGYTDATPYASDKGYSNWELSTDRANASRRALVELGLDYRRITRVVGRADTDLLVPEHPASPRNRRISITLLRQAPLLQDSRFPAGRSGSI